MATRKHPATKRRRTMTKKEKPEADNRVKPEAPRNAYQEIENLRNSGTMDPNDMYQRQTDNSILQGEHHSHTS